MGSFKEEFANRVRNARRLAGMTQSDLARKMGVTVQCISSYEKARTLPNAQAVSQLAKALGVRVDAIIPPPLPSCDQLAVPCCGQTPVYKHVGDAGADIRSAENAVIEPGGFAQVHTGLRVALPYGCVGLLFARSGTGLKGIGITHGVGVIDAGYRGEVSVCLYNMGNEPFEVRQGDRIAQLVVIPVPGAVFEKVCESDFARYERTERGTSGYGSTGRD